MKRNNLFIALVATLLFASCCCKDNTFNVEALIDNMPDTKFYLVDKMAIEVIDSTLVTDGVVAFTQQVDTAFEAIIVDATDATPDMKYHISDTTVHFSFIAEPGKSIKIDLNQGVLLEGTPLNNDYIAFNEANKALNGRIKMLSDSLTILMENNTLSPEDAENAFYAERDVHTATFVDYMESMLPAHTNDIVGAIILNTYLAKCEDDERIDAMLATMSDYVLQNPAVSRRIQRRIMLQETAEGTPFKDFSVEYEDGTTASLSDYVGKGKYVLADFWASWCPPCRKSMPLLKELYNGYQDKGLEILGLATRDKIHNSLRAIEEEQMPWPQILDNNNTAAEAYGVSGIPHLILFGPDGTIVLRGYPDEEFLNQVKEIVTKQ